MIPLHLPVLHVGFFRCCFFTACDILKLLEKTAMAPTSCTSQEMVSPFTDGEMEMGEMVAEVSQVLRSGLSCCVCEGAKKRVYFNFFFFIAIRPVLYPGVSSYITPIKINIFFYPSLILVRYLQSKVPGESSLHPHLLLFISVSLDTSYRAQDAKEVEGRRESSMNDRYGVMKDEVCSTLPKKRLLRDKGGFFFDPLRQPSGIEGAEKRQKQSRGEK